MVNYSGMEMMDYVDDDDQVVGQASKKEVYARALTHRIAHIWIFNDAGEVALQKRSASCNYCPLHWSMSAAGHVDAGESYETAALRELQEEMGVELPIMFVTKTSFVDPRGIKKFIGVYAARSNGPFTLSPDEVDQVQWFSRVETERLLQDEPCHPQLTFVLQHFGDQLWPLK